ncbi:MAG: OmpA family protein [Rhodobacteraceae bacterium]|nr:MAG: OmpA family protein [Paracoccaceae bacterium]
MKTRPFPLLAASVALVTLAACTQPGGLNDPNNPNRQRDAGVLIGAGAGAVLGQITGGDTEATVAGALLGGIAGGVIGSNLDRQEADLRARIGDDRVRIMNTGDRLVVTMPQDLLFATDSATLRPDLRSDLRAVAQNLQAYPNSTIQVIGHTDSDGDAGYNLDLSDRRANAVAVELQNGGVPFARIQTIGRGESQPVASNLTPEGRALNRRVEIVILPNA